MRRTTTLLVLYLLLSALPVPSHSQTHRSRSQAEFQRQMNEQQMQMMRNQEEFRQRMEEQRARDAERRRTVDEYSDEAYQEAVGATPEQWKAIKPPLERIRKLKDIPHIDIDVYWVGGSGGYRVESFVETADGGRSTANASGQFSATQGVRTDSDSTARSRGGAIRGAASGHGRAVAGGATHVEVQTPGPVRKQVGDVNLGWQWQRPSLTKGADTLSESEQTCEQLLDALEAGNPDPDQLRRQVEALRRAREQRQRELQQARQQLREAVTPEQEARLILMGHLD